jgi:SAM-dependent methyltransferase
MNAETTLTTWEEAVLWLRAQPEQAALVRDCYFDDPLLAAAQRFYASQEWQATRLELPFVRTTALDLGAGRGISSYALARDGWQVTALEPDPSPLVGAAAIRQLATEAGLSVRVVQDFGETLPFDAASFGLVMARQVLHHARDLRQLLREVARVLKPGGVLVATREHVISDERDLPRFLAKHPLHHLYGGENAFTLATYQTAIETAGLTLWRAYGPWESPINTFPLDAAAVRARLVAPVRRRLGPAGQALVAPALPWSQWAYRWLARAASQRDTSPGRLYSFVAVKP